MNPASSRDIDRLTGLLTDEAAAALDKDGVRELAGLLESRPDVRLLDAGDGEQAAGKPSVEVGELRRPGRAEELHQFLRAHRHEVVEGHFSWE